MSRFHGVDLFPDVIEVGLQRGFVVIGDGGWCQIRYYRTVGFRDCSYDLGGCKLRDRDEQTQTRKK